MPHVRCIMVAVTYRMSAIGSGADKQAVVIAAYVNDFEAARQRVTITSNGYGYVHGLSVDPAYRRTGIGTALVQAVISYFGYMRLELIASDQGGVMNAGQLMEWYKRFGFIPGPSASGRIRTSDKRRMFRNGQAVEWVISQ
jgi:ribosomal protein S18 acetylase RimI-like enzyme